MIPLLSAFASQPAPMGGWLSPGAGTAGVIAGGGHDAAATGPTLPEPMREQLTLDFTVPAQPVAGRGGLNLSAGVREALNAAIKASGKSRDDIAAAMSASLGTPITLYMLNAWTASSREDHKFPLQYVVAFEMATGSYALTELHNTRRGCRTLIGADALLADLGELEQLETDIRKRKQALKRLLSETPRGAA